MDTGSCSVVFVCIDMASDAKRSAATGSGGLMLCLVVC
jgi:hypothetical protein